MAGRPGVWARILARLRARSLDERLLGGARPEESPQLMARAAVLSDPGYRTEVSAALREMLDAAEHARRIFMKPQLRLRELDIIRAGSLIRGLADELERNPAVTPRGVVLADRLIRDGESPMFWPSRQSVEDAVTDARAALEIQ